MQDLFRKYLQNGCSPVEAKELLENFNDAENEALLRGQINDSFENDDTEDDGTRWEAIQEETFEDIKKQLNPEKGKLIPFTRNKWFRVAAAAVFIAGGYTLYTLIDNRNQQKDLNEGYSTQGPLPGSNKAVLTLADGSTINLETVGKGNLTKQGNITLLKPADGQLVYKSSGEKSTEVLLNSIVTPRAGQYQVILSDGSVVWLNAASSLRFPATFSGKERKVVLSGEAYFEVAKNSFMPFTVEIPGKAEVEVLGTHFNVSAYDDEAGVNTTLLEGSVNMKGLATGQSQIISPGDQAQLDGKGEIRLHKDANTEMVIAWKNGLFSFSNADLGTVFRHLSRWYDVDIIMDAKLPARQFNGDIQRNLTLTQVLRLLESNNVHCRLEGKKLIVLQ